MEASNLNRQRFYSKDIGQNKVYALAENLLPECVQTKEITAFPLLLVEEALDSGIELRCDVAICGVDNNPACVAASRYLRSLNIPVIFTTVSADADHGYVCSFKKPHRPMLGCLFPDAVDSRTYACPAIPAIAKHLANSWSIGRLRSRYLYHGQAERVELPAHRLVRRTVGWRCCS